MNTETLRLSIITYTQNVQVATCDSFRADGSHLVLILLKINGNAYLCYPLVSLFGALNYQLKDNNISSSNSVE